MSQELITKFKNAAAAKNWVDALITANAFDMGGLLKVFAALKKDELSDMEAQLVLVSDGRVTALRMKFAITVVRQRKIPDAKTLMGDEYSQSVFDRWVPPDQVATARQFLASTSAAPAKRKLMRVAMYWTRNALGETVSPGYIQKAQELLRKHDPLLNLDILTQKFVSEAQLVPVDNADGTPGLDVCPDVDAKAAQFAKAAQMRNAGRVVVVWFKPGDRWYTNTTPPYLAPAETGFAGINCHSNAEATRFVLIDVTNVNKDNVPLLHELGHAAGNAHRFEKDHNFMSYGKDRNEIDKDQLEKLQKAWFTKAE